VECIPVSFRQWHPDENLVAGDGSPVSSSVHSVHCMTMRKPSAEAELARNCLSFARRRNWKTPFDLLSERAVHSARLVPRKDAS
jgi:hypothetical protein